MSGAEGLTEEVRVRPEELEVAEPLGEPLARVTERPAQRVPVKHEQRSVSSWESQRTQ